MSPSLPVGLALLAPCFGKNLPPTVRRVLDSHQVLGFSVGIDRHLDNATILSGIKVCLPGENGMDPQWVEDAEILIAAEVRIPGLVHACLALGQSLGDVFCAMDVFQVWRADRTDGYNGLSARFTILPSGYTVSVEQCEYEMEMEFNDLYAALEEPGENDEELSNLFSTGKFLTLLLNADETSGTSAHATLSYIDRAAPLLAEWKRAYPQWSQPDPWGERPALPLTVPDSNTVGLAIKDYKAFAQA